MGSFTGQEAFDVVARLLYEAGVDAADVPSPDVLVKIGGIIIGLRSELDSERQAHAKTLDVLRSLLFACHNIGGRCAFPYADHAILDAAEAHLKEMGHE